MMLLLEISIYSVAIFMAIVVFKKLAKDRLSPNMHLWIWVLLIARLLMPFTLDSKVHLINLPVVATASEEDIYPAPQQVQHEPRPEHANANNRPNTVNQQNYSISFEEPVLASPKIKMEQILLGIWICGVAASILHIIVSYNVLRRDISTNTVLADKRLYTEFMKCKEELGIKGNVQIIAQRGLGSPALLFPNRILMPIEIMDNMTGQQLHMALTHELTHFKRKDQLLSFFLMVIRAVYWFNPVVWVAVVMMRNDIETACDYQVVRQLDMDGRSRYASAVLFMYKNVQPQLTLGMALGSGKRVAEQRVRGIFMDGKSKRSAKVVAVVLCIALLITCFTTACQPTPDTQAVIGKGDASKNIEKAAKGDDNADKIAAAGIPEGRYTYEDKTDDGKITIKVDADIITPSSGKLPIAYVRPMNFTQEQVTALYEHFFPNKDASVHRTELSKSEIEKSILETEKLISTGKYDDGRKINDDGIQSLKETLEELKGIYHDAPELIIEEISDGTLKDNKYEWLDHGHKELNVSVGSNNSTEPMDELFSVVTGFEADDGFDSNMSYFNFGKDRELDYSLEDSTQISLGDAVPEKAQGKLQLTVDEAKEQVDEIFAAAGFDNVQYFAAYLVDDHGTGHSGYDDEDGNFIGDYSPAENYAYMLYYTQTVNGIPTAVHDSGDAGGGKVEYSVPWSQENITCIVSDIGIESFGWSSPVEVTELLTDNADIIPFEDAITRFKQNIINEYTWSDKVRLDAVDERTVDIVINRIMLTPVRERVADKPNEKAGVFVPAYVFYGYALEYTKDKATGYERTGYITGNFSGKDFETGPLAVMAISAVDGSIIEMSQ